MKKQNFIKIFLGIQSLFLTIGCITGTEKQKTPQKSVTIFSTSPQLAGKPASQKMPPKQAPPTPQTPLDPLFQEKDLQNIFLSIKNIEENFISQDCEAVRENQKKIEPFLVKWNLDSLPPLAHAALVICNGKAVPKNTDDIKKAVAAFETLPLRYPVFNEVWFRNTLADFYIAQQDTAHALSEKKIVRNLILAQQSEISTLNAQILELNPTEPALQISPQSLGMQHSGNMENVGQTLEQMMATASQMINNDAPEQAIALIDTLPTDQKTEAVKRIRADAVHALVMNLRYKVSALFRKSTEQTGQIQKETLSQCEQILQGIIKSYPEYNDLSAVKNNLKQIQRELQKP